MWRYAWSWWGFSSTTRLAIDVLLCYWLTCVRVHFKDAHGDTNTKYFLWVLSYSTAVLPESLLFYVLWIELLSFSAPLKSSDTLKTVIVEFAIYSKHMKLQTVAYKSKVKMRNIVCFFCPRRHKVKSEDMLASFDGIQCFLANAIADLLFLNE